MDSVPPRFMQAIQLHLIRNFWPETRDTSSLILGIFGPPGQGKSYQCRQALESLGYRYISMSTSDFGSAMEAESSKNLRAKYAESSVLSGMTQEPHSLIIDDIDMGLGNFGGLTQYTVNLQYAIGEIMHICDCPTSVKVEPHRLPQEARRAIGNPVDREIEIKTGRIPIFVTGNDFGKLYAPLLRDGRMTAFSWMPTPDEQAGVVAKILPGITKQECGSLVSECGAEAARLGIEPPAVSFFAALKNAAFDEMILGAISENGWPKSLAMFAGGGALKKISPGYGEYLAKAMQQLSVAKNGPRI